MCIKYYEIKFFKLQYSNKLWMLYKNTKYELIDWLIYSVKVN